MLRRCGWFAGCGAPVLGRTGRLQLVIAHPIKLTEGVDRDASVQPPRSGERRSVARIGGLGDGPSMPALCDDNVGGRRLDHSLNLGMLMPGQHQKPVRIGADLLVLSRRQLDRALAVQPRALAAIGGPLTLLTWPVTALDGFIDPTSKALVRGHERFTSTVHTLILSKRSARRRNRERSRGTSRVGQAAAARRRADRAPPLPPSSSAEARSRWPLALLVERQHQRWNPRQRRARIVCASDSMDGGRRDERVGRYPQHSDQRLCGRQENAAHVANQQRARVQSTRAVLLQVAPRSSAR
jgi:hypothetical protein